MLAAGAASGVAVADGGTGASGALQATTSTRGKAMAKTLMRQLPTGDAGKPATAMVNRA